MRFRLIIFVGILFFPSIAWGFNDVPISHDQYQEINYLFEQGLVYGYSDGSFHPDYDIPRVEALAMIFQVLGKEQSYNFEYKYHDVQKDDWFYNLVQVATNQKIIRGDPHGTFRPRDSLNYAEAIKILIQSGFRNVDFPVYKDDPLLEMQRNDWFAPYMAFAKEKKLINPHKFYDPSEKISRAKLGAILYRVLKYQEGDIAEISRLNSQENNEYRLYIPKISIRNVPINYVEDFSDPLNVLWNGVGNLRYQPGILGKIVLYGHSSYTKKLKNNYDQIFIDLDQLVAGDKIYINYHNKGYIYEINNLRIIDPDQLEILQSHGEEELVLFTCWPPQTYAKRLVVSAKPFSPKLSAVP